MLIDMHFPNAAIHLLDAKSYGGEIVRFILFSTEANLFNMTV